MNKALVVLSSGMDSATALALCVEELGRDNVYAVNFHYGSKHNDEERNAAARISGFFGIACLVFIDLDFINKLFKSDLLKSGGDIPEGHYAHPSMKRTVVPFRNGIMLSIATGYAESIGAKMVVIGNHAGDHEIYPDCREKFITPMAKAMKYGTYSEIELYSPFCDLKKEDIVRIGDGLNVPYQLTYSCYNGRPLHCGRCGTCCERIMAFKNAGVKDPTAYEDDRFAEQAVQEFENAQSKGPRKT